jgi:hypothetical protein
MKGKAIVVQGAVCMCKFGSIPDRLKVLSHQKEYANDKAATRKLIVTTKELGATFEMNSFGVCTKQGYPPPPCKVMVTEWKNFYREVELSNGGNIILETSEAVCALSGGIPCIKIIHHGQITEPGLINFQHVNPEVQGQLNPLVNVNEMLYPERKHEGLTFK